MCPRSGTAPLSSDDSHHPPEDTGILQGLSGFTVYPTTSGVPGFFFFVQLALLTLT